MEEEEEIEVVHTDHFGKELKVGDFVLGARTLYSGQPEMIDGVITAIFPSRIMVKFTRPHKYLELYDLEIFKPFNLVKINDGTER